MYFTSKLVENKLLERIKKDLSFVDNSILEFRVLSELGYIISSQLQAMKTAKYQINEEVVEVITKRYSEFYLPELTHLTKNEYNIEFIQYYKFYLDYFNSINKPVSILEVGGGIGNLAYFLTSSINSIRSYTIYENNSDLISLGNYIYPELKARYINCDVKDINVDMIYDCVIIENTIKYMDIVDTIILFEKIFEKNYEAEIIVLDNDKTISKIYNCHLKLNIRQISDNRVIIKKSAN